MLDQLVGDFPGPIHYFAKRVDLNEDRNPEWIVHLVGPSVCGTGGCDTLVFAQGEQELELVTRIAVTRPPIVVARSRTRGWRDLIVRVRGGGIVPGYDATLRYDGTTYPTNPTMHPAEPLRRKPEGDPAIPTFQSFTDGQVLR